MQAGQSTQCSRVASGGQVGKYRVPGREQFGVQVALGELSGRRVRMLGSGLRNTGVLGVSKDRALGSAH
jgi:hypothetical protein